MAKQIEYLKQLVGREIGERERPLKPRRQAWVRVNQPLHRARVASEDGNELVAIVLDPLEQYLHRLATERVFASLDDQAVRLIDEEHSAECGVDQLVRLGRGLADVLGDEARAIDFNRVAFVEQLQPVQNASQDAGDRRLPGTWVALKDGV